MTPQEMLKGVEESIRAVVVNQVALMIALRNKGVLEQDEIEHARLLATHHVDQAWEEVAQQYGLSKDRT